jgi:CBS domain-containing protein
MLVKECMTRNVEIGNPNMSLQEAAQKMRDGDYGALPVGDNDRLVGMITDRDIAIRAVAEGKDPKTAKVNEIISGKVLYCFEDQEIEDVIQNLGDNQVRRLPVLDRNKRLVGIVSLGDVAQSDQKPEHVDEALSRISTKTSHSNEARF